MSGYYNDDDEHQRRRPHRSSRPVYEEEVVETRQSRGPRQSGRQSELVPRRGESSSSAEEISRDFPPGDRTYVKRKTTTRTRSADRHIGRSDRQSEYSDRPRGGKRDDRRSRYDSDSESDSVSPPPRRRQERRKSLGEQALAALGVGGAAGALASGGRDRDRDRDRDAYSDRSRSRSKRRSRGGRNSRYDDDRSRSRSRGGTRNEKIQQAAKAALTAGALEAWRARKEPGGLTADKGKRILTAAVGAAGIDGVLDRNPEEHGTRHTIQAALGGLASNRIINGRRDSGSRSRSRSRGGEKRGPGLAGVASAAGLAAIAGKAIKNYRSKSKDRGRREYSSESDSDGGPRPTRSQSVKRTLSRGLNRGMAAVGLSDRKHYSDDDDYRNPRPRGGGGGELARTRGGGSGAVASRSRGLGEDDEDNNDSASDSKSDGNSSDTDHYSSDAETKKHQKMRRNEILTAGLASVATVHAAHSVYQSVEKRRERHKKVEEGKMSKEEAQKLKTRALWQDAGRVGVAAIGLKGAYSEWKEMKEQREEFHHAQDRFKEKREHRKAKLLEQARLGQEYQKQLDAQSRSGSGRSSEPDLRGRYQGGSGGGGGGGGGRSGGRGSYDDYGPRYQDGNPYTSSRVPPPPMGSGR